MRKLNFFVLILMPMFLFSCYAGQNQVSSSEKGWNGNVENTRIVNASYAIASSLENNLSMPIPQDAPIIVASFVDVSDLTKSSAFGRIMSEQIGSRLAQKGYRVIEMKLRQNSIFVDPENKGEFLLSRNIKDISKTHKASIVVVGTYAYAPGHLRQPRHDKVYVSARMVDPTDSVIMSSCDYGLDFPNYFELMSLMSR